jgi:hypothetical protein
MNVKKEVESYIENLVTKYNYKPLPKTVSQNARIFYEQRLNGFENFRNTNIDGIQVCELYDRIVIGDYGAFVEFAFDKRICEFTIAKGQEWRFDERYLMEREISIKYLWLEFRGRKVYLQVNPVKYADYKPYYFYISVHDFDVLK